MKKSQLSSRKFSETTSASEDEVGLVDKKGGREASKKSVKSKAKSKAKVVEIDDEVTAVEESSGKRGRKPKAKKGKAALSITDLTVGKALSSRATCKICGMTIMKGTLRFGIRTIDPRGEDGYLTRWQHLQCSRLPFNEEGDAEKISGFDELDDEEVKEEVRKVLRLSVDDQPEHLRPLEPDQLVAQRAEMIRTLPEVPIPKTLTAQLLSFQKTGLNWLVHQEESDFKGGILADEMGMGKTIQAIALLLANQAKELPPIPLLPGSSTPPPLHATSATLIICPVISILQWQSEILKFSVPHSLRVYVYHGTKRPSDPRDLLHYDVILTTYSTIEAEFRKMIGETKIACEFCGKLFLPNKLPVHLRYFCGDGAEKTAAQAKQETKKKASKASKGKPVSKAKGKAVKSKKAVTTKVSKNSKVKAPLKRKRIVDASSSDDSADTGSDSDHEDDGDGSDSEGSRRPLKKAKLASGSIAIAPPRSFKYKSVLHQIVWHRIILDEAHAIKSRSSSTAQSIFKLEATMRWCLTGTPLQNRVGEFYSLLRYLRMDPYAYYFCNKCDCKSLNYNFGPRHDSCQEEGCGHTPMAHYSRFNHQIVNPIKKYGYVGAGRSAMLLLKGSVLDALLLRRVKVSHSSEMILPPRMVRLRRDHLDEREEDFYNAIYTQSRAQFDSYVDKGTLLNNYAHVFDLLMRLRQAVDHPYLVLYSKSNNAERAAGLTSTLTTNSSDICCICHAEVDDLTVSKCRHPFCVSCVTDYIDSAVEGVEVVCPACYAPLSVDLSRAPVGKGEEGDEDLAVSSASTARKARKTILSQVNLSKFQSSTKVEALMEEIHNMRLRDSAAKGLVFSQFVNMLDIVEYRLKRGGFKVVKITGGMTVTNRDRVLEAFKTDPSISVILISLKAGGVALNLTVANNVFLLDPWWNHAAEFQAIDRAHRLGQHKMIRAIRFVTENTIEEKILALQDKKRLVFDGTVGGDAAALGRLTVEDLRFLFAS